MPVIFLVCYFISEKAEASQPLNSMAGAIQWVFAVCHEEAVSLTHGTVYYLQEKNRHSELDMLVLTRYWFFVVAMCVWRVCMFSHVYVLTCVWRPEVSSSSSATPPFIFFTCLESDGALTDMCKESDLQKRNDQVGERKLSKAPYS